MSSRWDEADVYLTLPVVFVPLWWFDLGWAVHPLVLLHLCCSPACQCKKWCYPDSGYLSKLSVRSWWGMCYCLWGVPVTNSEYWAVLRLIHWAKRLKAGVIGTCVKRGLNPWPPRLHQVLCQLSYSPTELCHLPSGWVNIQVYFFWVLWVGRSVLFGCLLQWQG